MKRVARTKYRFPWRDGNAFRLLVDGERYFPAMLEALAAARNYAMLELYLVTSGEVADRFIDALTEAADRGVAVYALFDAFGARGLSARDRHRLYDHDIHLRFYNPLRYGRLREYLFRDHRKLLVVDGSVVYTGGMGLNDAFIGAGRGPQWRETGLEVRGPCVADWQRLFADNWERLNPNPPPLPAAGVPGRPGNQLGRVTVNGGGVGRAEVKRSFIKRIRASERRVRLCTAYFVPSWKLLRALRRAARRGVDVQLLLPGPRTDHPGVRQAGHRHYGRLLRNGVRIFEYQGRVLHAKTLLCDHWVAVGSSNMDRWNLRWNLEANQEAEDQDLARDVEATFEQDLENAREYHYDGWHRRKWTRRAAEKFWSAVDLLLERVGRRWRSRL